MNLQDQLAGEQGARRGMRRSAEHAEAVIPSWGEMAMDFVKLWLSIHGAGDRFVTPELRIWAHQRGLEEPPSARAWGAVMKAAAEKKLIRHWGFKKYGDKTMNTQAVIVWEKV